MPPRIASCASTSPLIQPQSVVPVVLSMEPEPLTLAMVFEAEEGGLVRYALGMVGRRAVAEELVQETFLRLHRVWAQVENPRAWLYRSLRNLALNHLRDRGDEAPIDDENGPAEPAAPPDDVLGRMEAVGMVETLLAEMNEEDRTLLLLKYRENLRYAEISRRTGINPGTVGYRLHHLLKGLAEALRRAGIEGSRG